MLSFITFKDAIEQVEIVADEQGIDELISYLNYIKNSKDHKHLIIDNELDYFDISEIRKGKTFCAKHVRLEFQKSTDESSGTIKR